MAIPGTRRRDRLEENIAAAGLKLDRGELEELGRLFPAGAACGARYADLSPLGREAPPKRISSDR